MKPVKNSTSKIWTPRELKFTKKQAEEGGYQVTDIDGGTEILDPTKDEIILRALEVNNHILVRLNTAYFEPINN